MLLFGIFDVKKLDRKLHTLVWSSSLSTRELMNFSILCAEKSIKDFSSIQSTSAFSNSTFKGGVAHHAFDF